MTRIYDTLHLQLITADSPVAVRAAALPVTLAHFGLVEGPCRLDQLLPRLALQRVRVRAVVVLVQAPAPVLQRDNKLYWTCSPMQPTTSEYISEEAHANLMPFGSVCSLM